MNWPRIEGIVYSEEANPQEILGVHTTGKNVLFQMFWPGAVKVDVHFMEEECQKILRGNGFKANVKIFTRLPAFLERLDSMNEHKDSLEEGIRFRPDEKYPELSRNELIKHTILAICL